MAHSWFRLNDPDLAPADHGAFVALFPRRLEVFADTRGGIVTAYFCRNISVAAVLTDIDTAADVPRGVPVWTDDAGRGRLAGRDLGTPASPASPPHRPEASALRRARRPSISSRCSASPWTGRRRS